MKTFEHMVLAADGTIGGGTFDGVNVKNSSGKTVAQIINHNQGGAEVVDCGDGRFGCYIEPDAEYSETIGGVVINITANRNLQHSIAANL